MFKKLRVLVFVIIALVSFAGSAYAYEVQFKDLAIYVDGELIRSRSTAKTIGEALKEKDIKVYENDKITKSLEEEFISGTDVKIERGFNVVVIVDGIGQTFAVQKGTKVGQIIAQVESPEGTEYLYDGNYAMELSKDDTITLKVRTSEQITTYESLPFAESEIEDNELEEGNTEVITEGSEGQKEIVTEIIYIDGVEESRSIIKETVVKEPVDKVIAIGTKPKQVIEETSSGKEFKYKSVVTLTATAYTNSLQDTGKAPGDPGYGITATGMPAKVGVVAVDPKVIPLYTELYVEGYGYCIAGDTGVYGNSIDLFFNSRYECIQFGRRPVTVYILE